MEKPAGYAVYADLLKRWDSEQLFHAASQVREALDTPGLNVLFGVLDDKRDQMRDRLELAGVSLEHQEYARQHGMLAGMRMSRDAANAVLFAAQERERELAEKEEKVGGV